MLKNRTDLTERGNIFYFINTADYRLVKKFGLKIAPDIASLKNTWRQSPSSLPHSVDFSQHSSLSSSIVWNNLQHKDSVSQDWRRVWCPGLFTKCASNDWHSLIHVCLTMSNPPTSAGGSFQAKLFSRKKQNKKKCACNKISLQHRNPS